MIKTLLALIGFWSFQAFALHCDCEVKISTPMTGDYHTKDEVFKTYELEDFSSFNRFSATKCRENCLQAFQKDLDTEKINKALIAYSQEKIQKGELGCNCTGLTTLKFPVRVKAKLNDRGLGSVHDALYIVNHEEICF